MNLTRIANDGFPLDAPKPVRSLAAFLDLKTNLMWTSEDLQGERLTHAQAIAAAASCRLAGFSDWRLPTLLELETLRDLSRHDPAADPDLGLQSAGYWTSTPAAYSPADYAWIVDFLNGDSYWDHHDNECLVRAVRSASPAAASQ